MSQHPLFPDPPVVAATITVTVTQEHIDRAEAEGLHPVSLAVIDALPGTQDADIIRDGAYAWTRDEMKVLRLDRDEAAFVYACDGHLKVSPVTFTAEVVKP